MRCGKRRSMPSMAFSSSRTMKQLSPTIVCGNRSVLWYSISLHRTFVYASHWLSCWSFSRSVWRAMASLNIVGKRRRNPIKWYQHRSMLLNLSLFYKYEKSTIVDRWYPSDHEHVEYCPSFVKKTRSNSSVNVDAFSCLTSVDRLILCSVYWSVADRNRLDLYRLKPRERETPSESFI